MRERCALHATVFTMALVLFLSPRAWAQQQPDRAAGGQAQNPAAGAARNEGAGQNRDQATPGAETIRGVISGITAEGEVVLDYRTNAAARAEGAFLTIVGSPVKAEAGNNDPRASRTETAQHASSGHKRHNIYVAWLTPRTKICEASEQRGNADPNQRRDERQTQSRGENKECTFDQIEVGDHVEIQFTPQEESGATNNVHQNQKMRLTHGRNRTFVGYAMSITVLPAKDHNQSSSGGETRLNERSR